MCFVRGDPRTADYTVRFFAQASPPGAANDNRHDVRRKVAGPKLQSRALGRVATVFLAAGAISGSLWVALNVLSMIADVFG